MSNLREAGKTFAKKLRIYPAIKAVKDDLYWTLYDKSVLWSVRAAFPGNDRDVMRYNQEFEDGRFINQIRDRMHDAESLDSARAPAPKRPAVWGATLPPHLRGLYVLCRLLSPKIAIETGVASGASSFVILSALEKNGQGRLFSIDLPSETWKKERTAYASIDKVTLPASKKTGWLVPPGLRLHWELVEGEIRSELPRLVSRLGALDFFYHDSEHTAEAMLLEYRTIWPQLNAGGILCSDDIGWNRAFPDFAAEHKEESCSRRCTGFGIIRKGAKRPALGTAAAVGNALERALRFF